MVGVVVCVVGGGGGVGKLTASFTSEYGWGLGKWSI